MNHSKSNLVSSAEQILGYHFRKPSLLEHALTHGSYSNGTISYERLEFIGDAALNLAIANYLNVTYPDLKPGHISKLRSANVSNEKLARDAVRHKIYPLVQMNSPQLKKKVKKFAEAVEQEPEDEIYGGTTKKAPKILADVIEAIAAAIYQDCNFNLDMMWKVVKKLLEPLITADTFDEQPVTALTEFCQKNGKVLQFMKPLREGKKIIVEVLIDGEKVGYGSSKNKDIARLNAARDALEKLNVEKSDLSIKAHKEVEDGEKSTLRAQMIPFLPSKKLELEESTKYEESEESTESEESEESEEDIPLMDKVIMLLLKKAEKGERDAFHAVGSILAGFSYMLGIDTLVVHFVFVLHKLIIICSSYKFILGFFLGVPWLIGAIMLCFSRVDYREKAGYISCTIAAVLFLVLYIIFEPEKELIIGDLRLLRDKNELMIGDFRLL